MWTVETSEYFNLHLEPHFHNTNFTGGNLQLQPMDGRFYNWTTSTDADDVNRYTFRDKGRVEGVYIVPHTQSDYHIIRMFVNRIPYMDEERAKTPQLLIFGAEAEGSPLHKSKEEVWARIEDDEDENGVSRQRFALDNTHYKGIPYSPKYPYTDLVWCGRNLYASTDQWSQKLKGKIIDGPWKECRLVNVFVTAYRPSSR